VNRDNVIEGRHIDRHPMSDRMGLAVFAKGTTVIAGQASIAGTIKTPEGDMRFQAGDYIVTDNPPTHVWPVRQQVFEATYNKLHDLEEGQIPTSEPVVVEEPALSAPPADVVQVKADEIGMERAGAEDAKVPNTSKPSQVAPTAPTGSKGDKSNKNVPGAKVAPKAAPPRPGIADSSSLKLE